MKRKYIYIEMLRIVACLAVIFNHVQEYGFFLFASRTWGSPQFYADLAISISSKFAVPVFFAISGALMLDREIEIKQLWKRRISKVFLILVLFSLISYAAEAAYSGKMASIKDFLLRGYEDKLNYSYWYLYAYIAYLITSPMLGTMLRHLKTGQIEYMLLVAVFFRSIVPAFEHLIWADAHQLSENLRTAWLLEDIVLYPSMGYYLHNRVDDKKIKRLFPCLAGVSLLGIAISCRLTYKAYEVLWTPYIQTYHELFAGVYGATVFLFMRMLFGSKKEKPAQIVATLRSCTLGVYLLHSILIEYTWLFSEGIWIPLALSGCPKLICGLMYVLAMFFSCALATALLKKIPGIKWLLS